MHIPIVGARQTSRARTIRIAAFSILALALTFGGLATNPAPASAGSGMKVAIVVGPVESSTDRYVRTAREYADLARSYGASVTEIYSPNATWARVQNAARGANILIYLGHGNGYPSPYGPFAAERKNGMGLNASAGNGNSNVKYFGQKYMKTLEIARNSVVLLNHLCYASGNSEPGRKNPSQSTAKQRADGYASGFLRAGARAVFANGNGSLSSILTDVFTTDRNIYDIFQGDWSFTGDRDFRFTSTHHSWATAWLDPRDPGRYYHSVVGRLSLTATQIRAG